MRVRFSERALAYLRAEQAYLGRFDKRAARATVQQIKKTAEMIGDHPRPRQAVAVIPRVRRYVSAPYIFDYTDAGIRLSSSPFGMNDRTCVCRNRMTHLLIVSKVKALNSENQSGSMGREPSSSEHRIPSLIDHSI